MGKDTIAEIGIGIVIIAAVVAGYTLFEGRNKAVQPAPQPKVVTKTVEVPRPVTEVACGKTYQLEHVERYYPRDVSPRRVAVNFAFAGDDRGREPQYLWDVNVIGQSTEIRKARRVNPSLVYSTVTFLCQSDPTLEGHKISNVETMRYRLTLRRPLRQQTVIREGGSTRR